MLLTISGADAGQFYHTSNGRLMNTNVCCTNLEPDNWAKPIMNPSVAGQLEPERANFRLNSILFLLDTDSLLHVLGMLTNHHVGPKDFINLACASRSMYQLLNTHWAYIKPDPAVPRNMFLSQLPLLYGNVPPFIMDRISQRRQLILPGDGQTIPRTDGNNSDCQTRQLYIRANSGSRIPMLSPNRVVTSIKISFGVAEQHTELNLEHNIFIKVAGHTMFRMSGKLLSIFGDVEGNIDTNSSWHDWIMINNTTPGNTDMTVTIVDRPVHPDDISASRYPRWNLLFYLGDNTSGMADGSVVRFYIRSNHIDDCLVFYFEPDNNSQLNVVQFELLNFYDTVTIPGWCCQCTKTFGGAKLQGCLYRIPIHKRIDMAIVNCPKLQVTFDRPVTTAQMFHVGAISYNYAGVTPVGIPPPEYDGDFDWISGWFNIVDPI